MKSVRVSRLILLACYWKFATPDIRRPEWSELEMLSVIITIVLSPLLVWLFRSLKTGACCTNELCRQSRIKVVALRRESNISSFVKIFLKSLALIAIFD